MNLPLLVDGARLNAQIHHLGELGQTPQRGVTRLAFTREDMAARKLLMRWMEEAGLSVHRDAVGNLIGVLDGREPHTTALACGSHLDTVINAGKYDGIIGILAAVECARILNEQGGLNAPLYVICFVMEESARFGAGYGFGSRVMTGHNFSRDELFSRDRSKTLLARAVQELKGWETGSKIATERTALRATQDDIAASRFDWSRIRAFLELHIEQGPVLEHAGTPIGIVTAVAAPTRYQLILTGEQNHSGTTPMSMRHDALAAASEIILRVESLARRQLDPPVVATVGVIQAEPNIINAIPGRVELRLDVRSAAADAKREYLSSALDEIHAIANQRGIALELITLTDESPVQFDDHIINTITKVCSNNGWTALPMPSGAGHDAAHVAHVVPSGMIFIPSRNGVSHDPQEYSSPQAIALGANALLATLRALDATSSS